MANLLLTYPIHCLLVINTYNFKRFIHYVHPPFPLFSTFPLYHYLPPYYPFLSFTLSVYLSFHFTLLSLHFILHFCIIFLPCFNCLFPILSSRNWSFFSLILSAYDPYKCVWLSFLFPSCVQIVRMAGNLRLSFFCSSCLWILKMLCHKRKMHINLLITFIKNLFSKDYY